MKKLYITIALFCVWTLVLWILGLHLIAEFIDCLEVSFGLSIGITYAFSSGWVVLTIGIGLLIFAKR